MKIIRTLNTIKDIEYVDCVIGIKDLAQCCINGVSSNVQTVRNLPYLLSKYNGHYWCPRINLNTGEVIDWPQGIRAEIYFEAEFLQFSYLDENRELVFSTTPKEAPKFLQLDLIRSNSSIRVCVNSKGFIEFWPDNEFIINSIEI